MSSRAPARAVFDEVQRRRRRGRVARGEAATEVGPGNPASGGALRRPFAPAHAAALAMPFRAATIATTSRRIRVSSKSFGV